MLYLHHRWNQSPINRHWWHGSQSYWGGACVTTKLLDNLPVLRALELCYFPHFEQILIILPIGLHKLPQGHSNQVPVLQVDLLVKGNFAHPRGSARRRLVSENANLLKPLISLSSYLNWHYNYYLSYLTFLLTSQKNIAAFSLFLYIKIVNNCKWSDRMFILYWIEN